MANLGTLIEDQSVNALLSWSLVAILALVAVTDVVTGEWLWAVFSICLIAVALVPVIVSGDLSVIVSWEALLLATLPITAQLVDGFAGPMTYVSVATLALLIAVELVTFSETRMPPWFAVSFVVMTTMTVAAIWAVVQFHADVLLGTSFIPGRKELMWDLVGATAAGLAAGLVFEFYFKRRSARSVSPIGGETE